MDMDGLGGMAAAYIGMFGGGHYGYPIAGFIAGACLFLLAKWMDRRA